MTIDSLGLVDCHLLKIDVEGMEADVLAGARETIARCKPILFVENNTTEGSRAILEAIASLGGSFYSNDIRDYYLTPYDLGYGSVVKFDHDFIGREALEKIGANPRRRKVTLVLNGEDVARAIGTMFQQGPRAKYFDFPSSVYSTLPYDKVLKDGKVIGVSTWCGYSANEGAMLSLSVIDAEFAVPGTEVARVWGESGGGTGKPTVERHVQTEIRATVGPAPYSQAARTAYRPR